MKQITSGGNTSFCVGNIAIDAVSRSVKKDGCSIHLTWAEFDLLWYLLQNTGRVVLRDELFEQLLRSKYNGLDRTIDVRVSRLRRKLDSDPGISLVIQSVRSEGYCLIINPDLEHSAKN